MKKLITLLFVVVLATTVFAEESVLIKSDVSANLEEYDFVEEIATEVAPAVAEIVEDTVAEDIPLLEDFVEEIARIFYDKEFACLPVVSEDKLVGVVTEKHMLYNLIQLTGTHVQGSQIEVKVPHRPGILPEVTQIFGKHNVNIASVLIYPYKDDPNHKVLVFRVQTMNPMPIIKDIRQAGFQLLWPNNIMEPKL